MRVALSKAMVLKSQAKGSVLGYASRQQYDTNLRLRDSLIRDRFAVATNLYKKDLFAHYGCVNAIEFSDDGHWLVSGGDDKRVLLWNVQESISGPGRPHTMKGRHNSNIFCLCFDSCGRTVFSAGNDEQVVVHDVETGTTRDVFMHQEAVYGLSVEPNNGHVFASACDDGCILVYDVREPRSTEPLILASSQSAFHAVAYNPTEARLIASANSRQGAALWDVRRPKRCLLRYDGGWTQSAMSVRFNARGSLVLVLRRRRPPAIFRLGDVRPLLHLDHPGYRNSCTMKSCCFAGDRDDYVMSGSDDFRLYAWRLPDHLEERPDPEDGAACGWVRQAHLVLEGHRSIVNQVRFNRSAAVVASSGVEKMVKLWSSLPMQGSSGSLSSAEGASEGEVQRRRYTYQEYVDLVLESGQLMSHDYSHQSVNEDPRMMAFFDSLVQRDENGWTSSDSSQEGAPPARPSSSESSSDSEEEEEEERGRQIAQLCRLRRIPDSSEDSDDHWVTSSPTLPPQADADGAEPGASQPTGSDSSSPPGGGRRARPNFKRPRNGFRDRRSYRRRRRSGSADTQ